MSKFILYAYQNARWNQRKNAPKILQNVPQILFFLPKANPPSPPLVVCLHYATLMSVIFNSKKQLHV
jgi:hypothetical protein